MWYNIHQMATSNDEILARAGVINSAIKANIQVLASLVNSKIGLVGLIDDIDDDSVKETLSQLVNDISESIDELIESTSSLFGNFNALVRELEKHSEPNNEEKIK